MKTRKRELAKVGIFGSKENPIVVNEKDLLEILETFPEIKRAPIQFGHYSDASNPRLGNVISLEYDSNTQTLSGDVEEEDALSKAVDEGYYPDVSIGAKQRASDGKMYLHHLAYLGEEAPAVKDLVAKIKKPLGIAASDDFFIKQMPSPTARFFILSEPFHESNIKGNEDTPPVSNNHGLPTTNPPAGGSPSFSTHSKENELPNKSQEDFNVNEKELAEMKAENERLKKEMEQKDLLLSDSIQKQKKAEKEALRASLEGRVPKALHDRVLSLCDSFDDAKTIELSDGGAKKTVRPTEALAEIFAELPQMVTQGNAFNLSDSEEKPQGSVKPSVARAMMGHV